MGDGVEERGGGPEEETGEGESEDSKDEALQHYGAAFADGDFALSGFCV